MRCAILLLLAVLMLAAPARAQTIADLISPLNWRVASPSPCSPTSCCCFSDVVNTYRDHAGEVYFNGTVNGANCNELVKQDNVNPPSAYAFSHEFFAIKYAFSLTNSSGKWRIEANAASAPACGFAIEYTTAALLPAVPTPNPKPADVPIYALAFVGKWTFDSTTCASANPSCCCFIGTADIKPNPLGHPSLFIEGDPSGGCRVQAGTDELQDDFPFPNAATFQTVRVVGFLPNQDTYQITMNTAGSQFYTLSLVDQTMPQCSMFATMPAPSLPPMAKSWTATISANFHNPVNQNFYTLAYTEAFDAASNVYLTRGRFQDTHHVEVFHFNSGIVFEYNRRAPSATCTFTAWSQFPAGAQRLVRPSTALFDGLNNGTVVYVGQTLEARNILCDKWYVSTFSARNNISYTYSVYFAVGTTPGIDQVPVRVNMIGKNAQGNITVAHDYDWSNFVKGAVPTSTFALPGGCKEAPPPARLPFPSNNSLAGRPTPPTDMPLPPAQFTVTLEGKMDTDTDDANNLNDQVYTLVWSVDTTTHSERLDFYVNANRFDRSSPVSIDSYIYKYTPGTPWGTTGTMYRAFLNHSASAYQNCQTASGYFPEATESPLHNYRAGTMSGILTQPQLFCAPPSNHIYVGQAVGRGVLADVYRGRHSTLNDGVQYEYVTDLLFFPDGWAFPGRNVTDKTRVPLRVINQGNQTNSSGTYEYKDFWDLFFFTPGAPDPSRFDPLLLGCASPAPPPPPAGYSEMVVVFAAVFGTFVGAFLAAVVGTYYWRKYKAENPVSAEPIQLRNIE